MSSVDSTPTPVSAFLSGIHTLNSTTISSPFSVDALLIDESKPIRGRQAIHDWAQQALVDHKATITVNSVTTSGMKEPTTLVHVTMDGDFEAEYGIKDPFSLWMHFTLAPKTSGLGIMRLEIYPFSPSNRTVSAVWASHGDLKDPLSTVRLGQSPFPSKPTTGHDWVPFKMSHASLNQHDIFTLKGFGMHELKFPLILGNDGVGYLVDESDGTVTDKTLYLIYNVVNDPAFQGDDGTLDSSRSVLGEIHQGTLSTYAWVPRGNLIPVPQPLPKSLEAQHLATLGTAYLTAYRGLFVKAAPNFALTAGKETPKILIQGSAGGVAVALIQLATAAGYEVHATGRTASKRDFARSLGATVAFDPSTELSGLTGQYDGVFNIAGGETYAQALKMAKVGGVVVVCGMHAGQPPDAGLMDIFAKGLTVKGVCEGTKQDLQALLEFVIEKEIVPVVDEVLPMDKAGQGLERLWKGDVRGKVVVEVA